MDVLKNRASLCRAPAGTEATAPSIDAKVLAGQLRTVGQHPTDSMIAENDKQLLNVKVPPCTTPSETSMCQITHPSNLSAQS